MNAQTTPDAITCSCGHIMHAQSICEQCGHDVRRDQRPVATRIESVADATVEATLETLSDQIGTAFPEAKTGDESPGMAMSLRATIHAAIASYLTQWTRYNLPQTATISDGGDLHCSCGNRPSEDGFNTVDSHAREVQPTRDLWPLCLYQCNTCGTVYHCPANLPAGTILHGEHPDL